MPCDAIGAHGVIDVDDGCHLARTGELGAFLAGRIATTVDPFQMLGDHRQRGRRQVWNRPSVSPDFGHMGFHFGKFSSESLPGLSTMASSTWALPTSYKSPPRRSVGFVARQPEAAAEGGQERTDSDRMLEGVAVLALEPSQGQQGIPGIRNPRPGRRPQERTSGSTGMPRRRSPMRLRARRLASPWRLARAASSESSAAIGLSSAGGDFAQAGGRGRR